MACRRWKSISSKMSSPIFSPPHHLTWLRCCNDLLRPAWKSDVLFVSLVEHPHNGRRYQATAECFDLPVQPTG